MVEVSDPRQHVADVPGDPRHVVVVDVGGLVRHLVIVGVPAGREEDDGNTESGVLVVITLSVHLLGMARRIQRVVEYQPVMVLGLHPLH